MPDQLERALYDTIRYWGLFDRPVTAVELWRCLIVESEPNTARWHGQHVPALIDVAAALQESPWLKTKISHRWGYYFQRGREALVELYLRRFLKAQLKWKITRRVGRLLQYVPFVRGIFVTGSLAIMNTNDESDLDLLVVTHPQRIWLTRLLLLLVTQLTGRRRTHWDRKAPDKICLNHYVTEDSLAIARPIRTLYTAMLYTHLVPLAGLHLYKRFQQVNSGWLKRFVMYPEVPPLPPAQYVAPLRQGYGGRPFSQLMLFVKRVIERLLGEPLFDVLERKAEKLQRRVVAEHTVPGQAGRIALSDQELAFHPDSKEASLLALFHQDEGQRGLF